MSTQQPKLPKRSARFVVGKVIGGAVYVHRQYESLLPKAVQKAKGALPNGFRYTIVKYVMSDETVSFIHSRDFDSSPEPVVGDLYTVKCDGSTRFRREAADPWIYHHKWLFVADDYKGFDVEASRARSCQWLALDSVDFRRIGKKGFWEKNVLPKLAGEKTHKKKDEDC